MAEVLQHITARTKHIRLHCNPDCLEELCKLSWSPLENCLDRCGSAILDFYGVCKFKNVAETRLVVEGKLSSRYRDRVRVQACDLF